MNEKKLSRFKCFSCNDNWYIDWDNITQYCPNCCSSENVHQITSVTIDPSSAWKEEVVIVPQEAPHDD